MILSGEKVTVMADGHAIRTRVQRIGQLAFTVRVDVPGDDLIGPMTYAAVLYPYDEEGVSWSPGWSDEISAVLRATDALGGRKQARSPAEPS